MDQQMPIQPSLLQLPESDGGISAMLRAPKPEPLHVGMSPKYDKVTAALLVVQGGLYSPPRNKSVNIIPKNGKLPYTFSYTTLDVINEMLRHPLTENGLLLQHLVAPGSKGSVLLTRILHVKSGQYVFSVYPILGGDDLQGFGSATTYMRRYVTCIMFNIASDDDDDGAGALGNGIYPATPEEAQRQARYQANERHARLITECNGARTPAGVRRVLEQWGAGMFQFLGYRDKPDHADQWTAILDLTSTILGKVYGPLIAELWSAMLTARSQEDVAAVRARWERPDVAAAKRAMKEKDPEAFSRFNGQLVEMAQHVVRPQPVQPVALAEPPLQPAAEVADVAVPSASAPPPPSPAPTPEPEPDCFHLHDEVGDIMSEPFSARIAFAAAYADFTRKMSSDPDWFDSGDRQNLLEHNACALAWARQDPEAAALLTEADSPPARQQASLPTSQPDSEMARNLLVPVAITRTGSIDLPGYAVAMQEALKQVRKSEWRAFLEANRTRLEEMPRGTRLRVKQLIALKAESLGEPAL